MKVKLITISLQTGHVPEVSKADKRFKKGYRIISEGFMTYQMRMRLGNPNGQFRISENIRTSYGMFRVIATNFLPIEPEMDLLQCKMIEKGSSFEFNAEIDIMSAGYTIGEGSF